MMKNGQYTVESIEAEKVKLLFSEDEAIVELLPLSDFSFAVTEGDIVKVEMGECGTTPTITLLEQETDEMRLKVSSMLEKLKNKNKR